MSAKSGRILEAMNTFPGKLPNEYVLTIPFCVLLTNDKSQIVLVLTQFESRITILPTLIFHFVFNPVKI